MNETVYVNDLGGGELTVRVCITKRLRFRIWVAVKLVRVAAWLLSLDCRVEQDDGARDGSTT